MWASWKTTAMGVLVLVCGGTNYAQVLPEQYNSLLMLFCGVCTAFGLIAAKDSNVSNAAQPGQPQKVTVPTVG